MTNHRHPHSSNGSRRFMPQLEQLDERLVPTLVAPTGSTIQQAILNPQLWARNVDSNGVFHLRTNGLNDRVLITDNGRSGVNNLDMLFTNLDARLDRLNASLNRFLDSRHINGISLRDFGGTNVVNYFGETSSAHISTLNYLGGGGQDTFQVNLTGGISNDVLVTADGGAGNDRLRVILGGTVRSGHALGIGMDGARGWDDVTVDAWTHTPTIETGATLWANLAGYHYGQLENTPDSANNVAFWYLGTMNGTVTFSLHGSAAANDDEWISGRVWARPDSTGTVGPVHVWGGGGDDSIDYMMIAFNTNLHFSGAQDVHGGSGHDTCHWSPTGTEPIAPNFLFTNYSSIEHTIR